MLELGNQWAAEFMENNPGISVYVQGGGSGTGFKGLIDGEVDIVMTSRLILSEEAKEMAEKYNSIGLSFLVAKDALSIFLHHENPLNNLTLDQLKAIFTGQVTNWEQLGGLDETIQVVVRPPTSGTHLYFQEFVLDNAAYLETAINIPTNSGIVEYIENNRNAIGYGDIATSNVVKHCNINGVAAKEENVRNDKYPLSRYLYLYTITTPSGLEKRFIDWVISPAGQRIVKRVGFVPLWQE